MYHPYESFDAVNDFVTEAAHDPDVLAIKMTLYRVSGQSALVQALRKRLKQVNRLRSSLS